jgi:catechol 2,3-dioxygenase-like lactoylglutathione lyase family enzyme
MRYSPLNKDGAGFHRLRRGGQAKSVARLDHFTLRTRRLAETTDFFVRVLGLTDGARPAFPFPGAWLYLDGRAVVHLAEATRTDDTGLADYLGDTGDLEGKAALDHVAFRERERDQETIVGFPVSTIGGRGV